MPWPWETEEPGVGTPPYAPPELAVPPLDVGGMPWPPPHWFAAEAAPAAPAAFAPVAAVPEPAPAPEAAPPPAAAPMAPLPAEELEPSPWPPAHWAPPTAEELEPSPLAAPAADDLEASPTNEPEPSAGDDGLVEEFAPQTPDERLVFEGAVREDTRRQLMAERQLEALRKDRELAEENERLRMETDTMLRQRMEDIGRDVEALSNARVDTGRYMRNQGAGQTIAQFIHAGLSGFLNPRGPNSGIELAMRLIDQDIDAQRADLEQQRWGIGQQQGIVADLFRQSGDMFRAAETARLALYDRTEKQILAEIQQYDPRGTTFQRGMESVAKLRAAKAAEFMKLDAEGRKALAEEAKAKREAAKLEHEMEMDRKRLGLEYSKFGEEKRKNRVDEALAAQEAAAKKEEKGLSVAGIKDQAGAPLVAANEADGKIIKDQLEASGKAIRLLQQLEEMRLKLGPSLADWTSAERAKAAALHSKAVVMLKEAGKLGSLDKGSEGVIKEQIGQDISAFFDRPADRINATKESLYQDLQMTMKIRSRGQVPDMASVRGFIDVPGKPGAPKSGLVIPKGTFGVDQAAIERNALGTAFKEFGLDAQKLGVRPQDIQTSQFGLTPGQAAALRTRYEDLVKTGRRRAIADKVAAAPDKAVLRADFEKQQRVKQLQNEIDEMADDIAADNFTADDLEAYRAKQDELEKLTGAK